MTPSAHATAASDLLAKPTNVDITASTQARLAEVHAVLATKAGTGANYTAAEAELVIAERADTPGWIIPSWRATRALALAHLAD